MRIVKLSDLVETPWKNGGGITRNIADRTDAKGMIWRLSMADVATDGAFSCFAGLTRVLTVIRGDGMVLHGPHRTWQAGFATPVTFDGAIPVTATLTDGAIRDFNLMFDTARCDGTARVIRQAGAHDLGEAGQTSVLHAITGTACLGDDALAPGDTAIDETAPIRFTLPRGASALAITLRLRG